MKGVSEARKNEAKEQEGGFLGMLLDTLGGSLLGNVLTGKGVMTACERAYARSQGRGKIGARQDF